MNLRDRVLSDENIYAAIHALPNTINEKSLICGDQERYLKELEDIYKYGATHRELLHTCKNKLRKVLDAATPQYFKVSFFLKIKDFNNGTANYRPIHNCDIETHVCLLSLLQVLCFEDDYSMGRRELSGLAQLIPNNFWGNQLSTKGNNIYKPWAPAYTSYVKKSIQKAKTYKKTQVYNNEINLDFKDFFPSINLGWLSNTIQNKLSLKYSNIDDTQTLKRILELLLYFEIDSQETYNDWELSIYYDNPTKFINNRRYFTRGLPQGLPHTYFLANIVMSEIEPHILKEFNGDCDFYVDDIVIFCNCEKSSLKDKIHNLNYIFSTSEINTTKYSSNNSIAKFQKEHFNVGVQLHSGRKCSIIDLSQDASFASDNLALLYRNASGISIEIKTSLSDTNDLTTLSEINAILEAIERELDRLKQFENELEFDVDDSITLYQKRITSYYKYYTFRQFLILKKYKGSIDNIVERFKTVCKRLRDEFISGENLDLQIFQNLYRLLLKELPEKQTDIIQIVEAVDKFWIPDSSIKYNHLYYSTDANSSNIINNRFITSNYSEFTKEVRNACNTDIKNLKRDEEQEAIKRIIMDPEWFTNNDPRHYISLIDSNIGRLWISTKIKNLLDITDECGYGFFRKSNRPLLWYQLRLLHYLNLPHFNYAEYIVFAKKVLESSEGGAECYPVDYSIFHILPILATYVKDHEKNDILIQVHHYVYDIWKNGSKFLHFYTLHNTEHSMTLIRKCIELTTACGYFKLTNLEYYILFLSCYLHDISMVSYPDINSINNDYTVNADTTSDIKTQVIQHYHLVEQFFEKNIRDKHAHDSATNIRTGKFGFELNEFVRNAVAEISEAHGSDSDKIYTSPISSQCIDSKKLKIMLRLVDMLDMCEERVSPYYLSMTQERMPSTSRFHWLTHLSVKECKFESTYKIMTNIDEDITDSFIDFKNISENIRLTIELNTRQDTAIEAMPETCKNVSLNTSENGIKILFRNGECNAKACPFVCRWQKEKSTYLYPELDAFQTMLNGQENYYTSELSIEYKFANEERMGEHIPFISQHLTKQCVQKPQTNEMDIDLPFLD